MFKAFRCAPYSQGYDYDVWGNVTHKYGWGGEVQGGTPTASTDITYAYTGNRRNGFSYDAAGNLTNDLGQTFTYDATGQQATASCSYSLLQSYDGDGLRVKKNDNGAQTYYLRSSVLGGQVVAEIVWASVSWQWNRGYVYLGSQLLAVQQAGVFWMHEDPVTKSKRITNSAGTVVSTVELDPWGADTGRSSNAAFQPKKFTSYERDGNGTDEAMFRRYNRWQSRFDQPDPYDGSYSLTDPQSFNRYAYVQGDPVNFVDPSGLRMVLIYGTFCVSTPGFGTPECHTEVVGVVDVPDPIGPIGGGGPGGPGGGGPGGGGPQEPLPKPQPSPHPYPNDQQKKFNDCVSPAVSNYWRGFKRTGGKAIVGAASAGVGIAVFAGGPAVGFGVRAAAATLGRGVTGTSLFHALSEISDGGVIGVVPLLGGAVMVQGLGEMLENRRVAERAVADCASRFPNAVHAVLP